ncbi:MAG: hypothetical protein LBB14_01070 [Puniceicoccales bacterium]|jgi:hypothetical protein|nr:hypothetical protein [Puniceicoccales bacterium]
MSGVSSQYKLGIVVILNINRAVDDVVDRIISIGVLSAQFSNREDLQAKVADQFSAPEIRKKRNLFYVLTLGIGLVVSAIVYVLYVIDRKKCVEELAGQFIQWAQAAFGGAAEPAKANGDGQSGSASSDLQGCGEAAATSSGSTAAESSSEESPCGDEDSCCSSSSSSSSSGLPPAGSGPAPANPAQQPNPTAAAQPVPPAAANVPGPGPVPQAAAQPGPAAAANGAPQTPAQQLAAVAAKVGVAAQTFGDAIEASAKEDGKKIQEFFAGIPDKVAKSNEKIARGLDEFGKKVKTFFKIGGGD